MNQGKKKEKKTNNSHCDVSTTHNRNTRVEEGRAPPLERLAI